MLNTKMVAHSTKSNSDGSPRNSPWLNLLRRRATNSSSLAITTYDRRHGNACASMVKNERKSVEGEKDRAVQGSEKFAQPGCQILPPSGVPPRGRLQVVFKSLRRAPERGTRRIANLSNSGASPSCFRRAGDSVGRSVGPSFGEPRHCRPRTRSGRGKYRSGGGWPRTKRAPASQGGGSPTPSPGRPVRKHPARVSRKGESEGARDFTSPQRLS